MNKNDWESIVLFIFMSAVVIFSIDFGMELGRIEERIDQLLQKQSMDSNKTQGEKK